MATRYLGGVAIGGFFCAGEMGLINGQSLAPRLHS